MPNTAAGATLLEFLNIVRKKIIHRPSSMIHGKIYLTKPKFSDISFYIIYIYRMISTPPELFSLNYFLTIS